jgi:ADP-ribosylglycohydrolase
MTTQDRFRGCLLGLAVGDAVGTPLEFRQPGTFAPINEMVSGGPFGLAPGQWTDDTSMALCLTESLVECRGFEPVDQLRRYVRWWREGHLSSTGRCFDIGNATLAALRRFEQTEEACCGSTDPRVAGNGSLMRLAPVPMFYAGDPIEALERAGESSRTTHGAPTAVDACRYFAGLLVGALAGADKQALTSPHYSPVPGYWVGHLLVPEIDAVAAGSFLHREPPEIRGTGFVVASLEAALWAFHRSSSFREAVLLAANLGDDADTTAAVCGQLAGAFYGERCIPSAWLAKLAGRELIADFADRLFGASTGGH